VISIRPMVHCVHPPHPLGSSRDLATAERKGLVLSSDPLMISIERYAEKLEADASEPEHRSQAYRWKTRAGDYLTKVRVIYLILKHPKSPFLAKAVAGLSIGYIFSPIQLIPSFIPVIGWLDDIAVLTAGMWLLARLTPTAVILECQENAAATRAKWLHEKIATRGSRTWRFLQ
jgi:uncharacterized membrane protein YkvA (DUF1232 family)